MNEQKTSQLTVEEAYNLAVEHFNTGSYLDSDKLCTAIIQAEPKHIEAINMLGVIAQKLSNHELAIELFQRALNIDDNIANLYYNSGISLHPLGRTEEAIKVLKIALEKDPGNSQISEYLHSIDRKESTSEISKPQDSTEELLQRGIALQQSGQLDEAVDCYKKSLIIDPENAVVYLNVGIALQAKGKMDEAVVNYKKAISIKPDYADAYSNLGNTLKEQGKLDEAISSRQKAILVRSKYITDIFSNLPKNILKN
jgi:tetratricopeptide (TPR) repeat protein